MTPKKNSITFQISERKLLLRLFDIAAICIGLNVLRFVFDFDYLIIDLNSLLELSVLFVYLMILGTIFEMYDLKNASKLDVTFRNIVLGASTTVLFYLLTPYITPFLPENRLQIIYFYVAIIVSVFVWRWAYISFITSPRFFKKVLVLGQADNLEKLADTLKSVDPNYQIVGYLDKAIQDENSSKSRLKAFDVDDIFTVIEDEYISEVLILNETSNQMTDKVYQNLIQLLESGFSIREYTQVFEEMTYRVPVHFIGKDFYKFFPFSRSNQNKLYLLFLRLFDLLFSMIGIIIGVVFLPLVLIGNLIGNKGGLFYIQERVGRNGESFNIVKLRTMVANAEKDGIQWAVKNDKRITPFGNFLRRTRLDEIPQFFNVLKGEMSIIGPRPERPFFVKQLNDEIPFYEIRHVIKPGLTGWAQVNSRYGSSVDDSLLKLQYDLYYIKHRSVFLDFNIAVRTLSTILFYRGQ
ncbi:MAG: sugar transferase [Bacteroidetes bacterium MedPE-SWsnd-G2]|nr:MAG: sugar transferase [Bacteroidetes bacterium MedPE-SWsnd-G2]